MSEVEIRHDMNPTEIIEATKALQEQLDADLRSASKKMEAWQRARENYRRTKGTLEVNVKDTEAFLDSIQAALAFELHMAKARALVATAAVRQVFAEEDPGAEYRAACGAVLASAKVLENAAIASRDFCAKVRIPVVEEKVAAIVDAIQYARKCRAEARRGAKSWWQVWK